MRCWVYIFILANYGTVYAQLLPVVPPQQESREERPLSVMQAINRRVLMGSELARTLELANQAPVNHALQICQYREGSEMTSTALGLESIIQVIADTIPTMADNITFGNSIPYNLKNCYQRSLIAMREIQEILVAHPQIALAPNPFELTDRLNQKIQEFLFAANPLPDPTLYYLPGQSFLPHEQQTILLIRLVDKFKKFLRCTRPLIRAHQEEVQRTRVEIEDAERNSTPPRQTQGHHTSTPSRSGAATTD